MVTHRVVESIIISFKSRSFFWGSALSTTRKRGNVGRLAVRVSWLASFKVGIFGSASRGSFGVEEEHMGDVSFSPVMLIFVFGGGIKQSAHPRLHFESLWLKTSFAMNARVMASTMSHPSTHGHPTPKGKPLPVTHSPPNHALDAYFNSPQGRISPPPLEWGCPV